jgi:ERCC4-related helicase
MNSWHPFPESIQLHVPGRITKEDALRQEATAREILRRLKDLPGLVLADEVGMGKTFVALAVAASVVLSDSHRRPVVVMVPPSLKGKWPRDYALFAERCLTVEARARIRTASAETAVDFLKLLDDPEERRASIIFLTHGAMHRSLSDGWVKLAMIERALRGRHNVENLRTTLSRSLGKLLRLGWVDSRCPEIWERLLVSRPGDWLSIMHRHRIGPSTEACPASDDSPVPQAVIDVLRDFDTREIYKTLQSIPQRVTENYDARIAAARQSLTELLKQVWNECLIRLDMRLPLLIMDEAHHLKNPGTRLSGLFQNEEAKEDADEVTRGALSGVFERMLFLTATPFQLGHYELCSVLERFGGIAWDAPGAPSGGREGLQNRLAELRELLDAGQNAALNLDKSWGCLRQDDLRVGDYCYNEVESWWQAAQGTGHLTPAGEAVLAGYRATFERMRLAERALKPWVIRHLRPRIFEGIPRREKLAGRSIVTNCISSHEQGIDVSGPALLPFLLAARATFCNPDSRPLFAEGLASSYEAFLNTRKAGDKALDTDDDPVEVGEVLENGGKWYLEQIERVLPLDAAQSSASHPKIKATADRVMAAWKEGEKVLVFCHYVETGRTLRQVISDRLAEEVIRRGAEGMRCRKEQVSEELAKLGKRFFDSDSPVRRACDATVAGILQDFENLTPHKDSLVEIARRYLRTPSFLVRYFPLDSTRFDEEAVSHAFSKLDGSNMALGNVLRGFFDFLENRCGEDERMKYIEAIHSIQTGEIFGKEALASFADEIVGERPERLLPNVRLVNGATKQETRERLMLTFNSPFFPEVLIASSVMAEGVDLHRFCRYVIHHDLCWNPSTLEQRTGRVDRIGAKVETSLKPVRLYLPYLAETQDEKMYRVVMDRERWFSVVMGEKYRVDARSTEKLAQRLPLPEGLAQSLAFKLEA